MKFKKSKARGIMAKVYIIVAIFLVIAIIYVGGLLARIYASNNQINITEFEIIKTSLFIVGGMSLSLFIMGTRELTLIRREQSHKEIE